MTTYNTGNALGSPDPRDLYDNAQGLDEAVNTQTSSTWIDRFGVPRLTLKGMEDSASSGEKTYDTRPLMDSAPSLIDNVRARVTNDPIASNNGVYISIASVWHKTKDPIRVGPLLNSVGADYPLKAASRNGQVSLKSDSLNGYLLKVELLNVDLSYVYRFSYFGNGGYVSANRDAIIINKYKKDTYGTAAVREDFITTADIIPQFVRDGTVQTVVIDSKIDGGASAIITIDTSMLPTYGVIQNYENTAGTASYSWIIDPSLYKPKAPISANPLTVAAGNDFPLKRMVRDAQAISPPDVAKNLNGWLLDAKVLVPNTNDDFYYRLEYFGNGFYTAPNRDAIIINKYLKSTYATASVAIPFIRTSDTVPELVRDGKPQTIYIKSGLEPGAGVQLTFDTSKMPTYGTAVNYQGTGAPTKSWIIDPAQVILIGSAPVAAQAGVMNYTYTAATKKLSYSYRSGDEMFRVSIALSNYNILPNITTIEKADFSATPVWSVIENSNVTGDWYNPMKFRASLGNITPDARITYSGGNHGAGGGSQGYRTAKNLLMQFSIDGAPIDMDQDISGSCNFAGMQDHTTFRASNTIDSQDLEYNGTNYVFLGENTDPVWIEGMVEPPSTIRRYVLDRYLNVTFFPGGQAVECLTLPLEEGVYMYEDNALQLFTGGFDSTVIYSDSQQGERIPFADPWPSSGAAYRDSWAAVFKGAAGMSGMWIDKTFGAGDGRYVDATRSNFQSNSTKKCYAAVARAPLTGPDSGYDPAGGYLLESTGYNWRGGTSGLTTLVHRNLTA